MIRVLSKVRGIIYIRTARNSSLNMWVNQPVRAANLTKLHQQAEYSFHIVRFKIQAQPPCWKVQPAGMGSRSDEGCSVISAEGPACSVPRPLPGHTACVKQIAGDGTIAGSLGDPTISRAVHFVSHGPALKWYDSDRHLGLDSNCVCTVSVSLFKCL